MTVMSVVWVRMYVIMGVMFRVRMDGIVRYVFYVFFFSCLEDFFKFVLFSCCVSFVM